MNVLTNFKELDLEGFKAFRCGYLCLFYSFFSIILLRVILYSIKTIDINFIKDSNINELIFDYFTTVTDFLIILMLICFNRKSLNNDKKTNNNEG